MDPVDILIHSAVHHELESNRNPYITLETIILRLYKQIAQVTRVPFPTTSDKAILFRKWHDEILSAYETLRPNLSQDERACVERILSKDNPHSSELSKFACCWFKYDPATACKWFAVDGILGLHPKSYVQDAFSPTFAKHNQAVRALYTYYSKPEMIKDIVEKAFAMNENEPCPSALDPEVERCVSMYADMMGEEDMKLVSAERKSKLAQQQQPSKRKKVAASPQHSS